MAESAAHNEEEEEEVLVKKDRCHFHYMDMFRVSKVRRRAENDNLQMTSDDSGCKGGGNASNLFHHLKSTTRSGIRGKQRMASSTNVERIVEQRWEEKQMPSLCTCVRTRFLFN